MPSSYPQSESSRLAPPAPRPPLELIVGSSSVVFSWAGDRWTHRILHRHTDSSTDRRTGLVRWKSLEGPRTPGDDPRWPASPVLVELSRVALPTSGSARGYAVVGVGLAGRSHFSASITADPELSDTIRFEIACRLSETPAWLGSIYHAGNQQHEITADAAASAVPRTAIWSYSVGPQGIVAVSGATVATRPG